MNYFSDYRRIKRLLDFSLALFGLFLSLPLWLLFSFAILLEDGKPVFYIQERVGEGCVIFKAIKFRTMGHKNKKGSRIAVFLRRTALDELPQIINIVKGEMSFVGPRPLVPQELYVCEELKIRSRVLPGLTGLAQLMAAKNSPVSEKFKYDISYIKSQGIFLDIVLILRSFGISLRGRWDRMNKPQA